MEMEDGDLPPPSLDEDLDSGNAPAAENNDEPDSEVEKDGEDSRELPRRSSRNSRMPERFNDYIIAKCSVPKKARDAPPRTHEEAMRRDDGHKWEKALQKEIETLETHGGMKVVPRPENGEEIVPTRTIFEEKLDNITGEVNTKARVVARGDKTKLKQQKKNKTIDLRQIYSPVVSMIVVRIVLALAAAFNLDVGQNDIKRAFLNSRRNMLTYLQLPKGHPSIDGNKFVWQSNGITYGLLDAPKHWYDTISGYLSKMGYERCPVEQCLFQKRKGTDLILIVLHVDDMFYVSSAKSMLDEFEDLLEQRFELKKTRKPEAYLGMALRWTNEGISVRQDQYVLKMLSEFELERSQVKKTPMQTGLILEKSAEGAMDNKELYQQIVGSLLYIGGHTRVDISYAVNQLGTMMNCPELNHLRQAKNVLRYLKGTKNYGLLFPRGQSKIVLEAEVDSDYANDQKDRKSYTGYIVSINGTPVTWATRKQKLVTLSSTEAEYVGFTMCAKTIVWIQNILMFMGEDLIEMPTTMYCDNESAMQIAKGPVASGRTKHIDVRMHWIRDMIDANRIELVYRNTHDLHADMLTKNLPQPAFEKHRDAVMVNFDELNSGMVLEDGNGEDEE